MAKDKEKKKDQGGAEAAVSGALLGTVTVPVQLSPVAPNGAASDDETDEPAVPRYKAKLAETPEYLQPKMKISVGEPAIYRSLFILDTLDNSTDSPMSEDFLFDLSEAWKPRFR